MAVSQADSIMQKYLRSYRRWKAWAIAHKLNSIPARPHEFVLYLQHFGNETSSKSAVKKTCDTVAWIHIY